MSANSDSQRQFSRSSLIMLALYAGSTGLTFLTGVVLARLLGAGGFGTYALAMTLAALAGMIVELGLPVLVMREVGSARATGAWGPVKAMIGWADRTIAGLCLVLAVAAAAYRMVMPSGLADVLLLAALLVPFAAIGKLRSMILLALDRVVFSQLPVMVVRPALFLLGCGGLWLVSGGLSPAGALAMQVAAGAVVMALLVAAVRHARPQAMAAAAPLRAVRNWLCQCLPMGVTESLRLLQGQAALLLVGALTGTAQAGIYRVADAVVQIALLLSSVAGTAATPMFARLWSAGDRAGLERVALLASGAMVGGAFVLGLPLAIFGEALFPMIFGSDFAACQPVFLVLWAGAIAISAFGLCLALANMAGQHMLAMQSFLIIIAVNLALGAILVPDFGAIGGAAASVAGTLAGSALCSIRLYRLVGINPTVFNRQILAIAAQAWQAAVRRVFR